MTLAATFLAAALAVPSMPPPVYDDCEVVTNCVFDSSRDDAKVFTVKIIRRGQTDPNLHVECSVDNVPLFIRIR